MRLNDAIYYSSNIIKKSKFKISISIITIFLLIVSSVVLISSGLNVKNNIKKNLIEAYELNGASVVIHKTSGIYNAEYNNLISVIDKYNIDSLYTSYNGIYFYDIKISNNEVLSKLTKENGIIWNSFDDGYVVGDTITKNLSSGLNEELVEFVIEDICEDIDYPLANINQFLAVSKVNHIVINANSSIKDAIKTYNSVNNLYQDYSSSFYLDIYNDKISDANLFFIIFVLAAVVELLMSIGLLINIIHYDYERSKYFLGIMRLNGGTKKDVFKVLFFETLFLCIIALALSLLFGFIMLDLLSFLSKNLVNIIFKDSIRVFGMNNVYYHNTFFWYIPLLIFFTMVIILSIIIIYEVQNMFKLEPSIYLKEVLRS